MRQLYDTVKSGYITEESQQHPANSVWQSSTHLHISSTQLSQGKTVIIELQTEPAIIFHGIPFLLEQLTN